MARIDHAKLKRREQARNALRDLELTVTAAQAHQGLPMLSNEEIKRRLTWIKASDKQERNARRHVGLNTISRLTNYGRDYLYKIINGDRIPTLNAQRKLSIALREMELPNLYS